MHDVGVKVLPYINGRIFDEATSGWVSKGEPNAVKKLNNLTVLADTNTVPSTDLSLDEESYGSLAECGSESDFSID